MGLRVDADIPVSTDFLGKSASDLQTGIKVSGGKITGTLKYVTGYTGFSGDPEEQEGHFLALHYYIPDLTGYALTVEEMGGTGSPVTLDADGLHILRIVNKAHKIKVTASKQGEGTFERVYDLSGLTLAAQEGDEG